MSFWSCGIAVASEIRSRRHEHLYESIEERLIRSDDLFSDSVATERKLGGSRTILSTISMLSNPALDDNGVYRIVPVERLVVDEASQIDSFELMVSSCFFVPIRDLIATTHYSQHLFHKFENLEKVCMFGDPKQCMLTDNCSMFLES